MNRSAYGGPRLLLRRLREVIADPASARARLDKLVVMIAANMVAEVCSIYLLRMDGQLELFATEGLNRKHLHSIQMRSGQGLVGMVARTATPLNIANAQEHPNFLLFPELGEEIYNAFLGVPILRAGSTLGVLVIQNRAQRVYTPEEIETLEAIALVLSEAVAGNEFSQLARAGAPLAAKRPIHLNGTGFFDAIGLGHVVLHVPRVAIGQLVSADPAAELVRLEQALSDLQANIDSLLDHEDLERGEHREIMEAYRMFANDRRWAGRLREAVETGLTAEAAVEKVQSDMRARMQRAEDPYLRERLNDFDDLANRLMRQLVGDAAHRGDLPKDAIIVARNMGPAELLDYDRTKLRGLVLEEGSPTSHVSIVARALGIASVGMAANIVAQVEQGDAIIVDGSTGQVHIRPPANVEHSYAEKVRFRAKRLAHYNTLRDVEAKTKDGIAVSLFLNAGLIVDLPYLHETNADGIGLFRTELQFMVAAKFPRIAEQRALYEQVLQAADGKPVIFRSLDVGGDKILPYMRAETEENPALGWRAMRLTLDRPGLLKTQVRALLLASGDRPLHFMFPMITDISEITRGREIVRQECDFLKKHGHKIPSEIKIGAMVEVPAILWQLEELVQHVDFISVGSNDLLQFLFAADRTNTRLAGRYDPLSISPLRVLRRIAKVAGDANVPLTLCGEMASKPLEALAVLAIGYKRISIAPSAVGPVKAMLLSLDIAQASAFVDQLLARGEMQTSVREQLQNFAQQHSVALN
ncbi:MAG: phosphoenolpyruvate--protein phosphotransferase [Pseudomonadota bacterium]